MARIVHHRPEDGKPLYDYNSVSSYDDCPNRIVCFSERDFNIILNALSTVGKAKTRCYVSEVGANRYEVVSDAQWENFVTYVTTIYNRMGNFMECNEYLSRIADALESMVDHQDKSVLNLFDVLEALGIEADEEQEDILEALQYILSLADIDLLPDFNIPKVDFLKSIGDMRFRGGVINLLQDIAISQRGQTVAQGGVDMVGVFDLMGSVEDKLLLAGGYAGKAIWLWKRIAPSNVPGWFSWITTLTGQVLGSIRNATYDIVEAIEDLDLSGIQEAIENQTITAIVNCNNCTSQEINDHIDPPGSDPYVATENDSDWDDEGFPPTSDDATWDTPPVTSDYKCQAANYIVDWMLAFYGSSEWSLSTGDNLITLADKMAAVLAAIPPIGATLNGLSSIIGLTLAYLSGGSTDIFETLNEKISDRQADLRCALYDATTSAEARDAFIGILEEESANSLQLSIMNVFLTMNNIMALLWWEPDELSSWIGSQPDDNCTCGGTALFQVVTTICSGTVTDGDFSEGTLTTIESCEGNFFGTIRAGMNLAGYPNAETPNRRVEFVSVTGSGTFYVTLVDENVPQSSTVESAASLSAFDVEITGIQITRPDASDTNPFEIQIRVYELV